MISASTIVSPGTTIATTASDGLDDCRVEKHEVGDPAAATVVEDTSISVASSASASASRVNGDDKKSTTSYYNNNNDNNNDPSEMRMVVESLPSVTAKSSPVSNMLASDGDNVGGGGDICDTPSTMSPLVVNDKIPPSVLSTKVSPSVMSTKVPPSVMTTEMSTSVMNDEMSPSCNVVNEQDNQADQDDIIVSMSDDNTVVIISQDKEKMGHEHDIHLHLHCTVTETDDARNDRDNHYQYGYGDSNGNDIDVDNENDKDKDKDKTSGNGKEKDNVNDKTALLAKSLPSVVQEIQQVMKISEHKGVGEQKRYVKGEGVSSVGEHKASPVHKTSRVVMAMNSDDHYHHKNIANDSNNNNNNNNNNDSNNSNSNNIISIATNSKRMKNISSFPAMSLHAAVDDGNDAANAVNAAAAGVSGDATDDVVIVAGNATTIANCNVEDETNHPEVKTIGGSTGSHDRSRIAISKSDGGGNIDGRGTSIVINNSDGLGNIDGGDSLLVNVVDIVPIDQIPATTLMTSIAKEIDSDKKNNSDIIPVVSNIPTANVDNYPMVSSRVVSSISPVKSSSQMSAPQSNLSLSEPLPIPPSPAATPLDGGRYSSSQLSKEEEKNEEIEEKEEGGKEMVAKEVTSLDLSIYM